MPLRRAVHPSATTRRARSARTCAVALVAALAAGLALLPSAGAVAAPADCRSLPVDADTELRSDVARATYGVDGTGVRIGIISNSFDSALAPGSTWEEDIRNGLLPGAGNPCGRMTGVQVLHDAAASPDVDDEGRAMAQLVHGVAPGAELFFAANDAPTEENMLEAIDKLHDHGVDIIVDDITNPMEPIFQESRVSSRIAELTSAGVLYLSAAGNETILVESPVAGQGPIPVNGWDTEAYRSTTCEPTVAEEIAKAHPGSTSDCMDFDPGSGALPWAEYIADFAALPDVPGSPGFAALSMVMQWGEAFGSARATFELALTVARTTGTHTDAAGVTTTCTVAAPCPSTTLLGAPMDSTFPVRGGDAQLLRPVGATFGPVLVSIVRVTKTSASAEPVEITPPVSFLSLMDGTQWIASADVTQSQGPDTVGRTIIGHNGAPAAMTIAATGYQADDEIEIYSSLGPIRYTLPSESSGATSPLDPAVEFSKPSVTSVDGVRQTVLTDYPVENEPGAWYFYGTSAATPNAGAVAALALQLDPSLSPVELRALIEGTAAPLLAPYANVAAVDSIGAGLVDAQALLARVAPAPQPRPLLAESGPADATALLAGGSILVVAGLVLSALRRRGRVRG